ncbi:MAG: hypothetical protein ABIL58_20090 [Pseudomonadota bacterium]
MGIRMRDLGIDTKEGTHDGRLTTAESMFLAILWVDHVGEANAISGDHLAVLFACQRLGYEVPADIPAHLQATRAYQSKLLDRWKRDVREMHNHLVMHHKNAAICSRAGAGGGYYMCDDETEARRMSNAFRARGLTGLKKAVRIDEEAAVEMMEQMAFDFDGLGDISGLPAPPVQFDPGERFAAKIVERYLGRMVKDPERFAEPLKKLGEKFGGVLVTGEQRTLIKTRIAELSELAGRL